MQKKIKIYAETLESQALAQFNDAMNQDFAIQGALMPDAHVGYSLPIGAVVATEGVVLPSWVGYDIGCGMCALPLPFSKQAVIENGQGIFKDLYRTIPTGFSINQRSHRTVTDSDLSVSALSEDGQMIARHANWERARGSLGGGNHFIEIAADETDQVWAVIHSGSRGVGKQLAQHYMSMASPNRKASEGHHALLLDSELGQAYVNDMNWGLSYALENRLEMMHRIIRSIGQILGEFNPVDWDQLINRNHNHATERDGHWIHRKGATHAEDGMMGVIPGNMRDGSFIVRGKGNPDALYSSSHGAGRVLGRTRAKAVLNLEEFESSMNNAGVVALVGRETLDESPGAYKDIHEVMRLQSDLVDVIHHAKPLINIKGAKKNRARREANAQVDVCM